MTMTARHTCPVHAVLYERTAKLVARYGYPALLRALHLVILDDNDDIPLGPLRRMHKRHAADIAYAAEKIEDRCDAMDFIEEATNGV